MTVGPGGTTRRRHLPGIPDLFSRVPPGQTLMACPTSAADRLRTRRASRPGARGRHEIAAQALTSADLRAPTSGSMRPDASSTHQTNPIPLPTSKQAACTPARACAKLDASCQLASSAGVDRSRLWKVRLQGGDATMGHGGTARDDEEIVPGATTPRRIDPHPDTHRPPRSARLLGPARRHGPRPPASCWLEAACLRLRIAALLAVAPPAGSIPRAHTSAAGGWVPVLLAVASTLAIVALSLAPAWLPSWRRWRAARRRQSSPTRAATQRFAEARMSRVPLNFGGGPDDHQAACTS